MAETTTAVLTPAAGVSPGPLIALLVLSALLLTALTAFTAWRAERARARALAELARQTERARAGEIAAGEAAILRGERDGLALTLERERAEARGLERQIADLKEAKEQMRQAFAENAGALMQSHSESFKSQNKEQIEHLLAPLKEDIVRFKRTLGEAHEKSVEQHGSLKEQIALLARHSDESSRKTAALTRALKGDVQLQGAWGEMKVETILKRLGFQEGVEYTRQETFSDGDARARTAATKADQVFMGAHLALRQPVRYADRKQRAFGKKLPKLRIRQDSDRAACHCLSAIPAGAAEAEAEQGAVHEEIQNLPFAAMGCLIAEGPAREQDVN